MYGWTIVQDHPILWGVVLLWLLMWIYARVTRGRCRSETRMEGKTVIITGADSGIGRETALNLAKRGARVIMAGINVSQAYVVRDQIIQESRNPEVEVSFVDLSCLRSVREFAEVIIESEERLDVLIHNAGVIFPPTPLTPKGLNTVIATNHLGPFLLTHLLADLLKKTAKSRIVIVSSIIYKLMKKADLHDLNPTKDPSTWTRWNFLKFYALSKFANALFSKELARRLEPFGVTCNFLHPGITNSSIFFAGPVPDTFVPAFNIFFPFLDLKTPEEGAQTTVHLAVSEDVEGVTGRYFSNCKKASATAAVKDPEAARICWKLSEKLVELKSSDPHI